MNLNERRKPTEASSESSTNTIDKQRTQEILQKQSQTINDLQATIAEKNSTIAQLKDELSKLQRLNRELQNSNDDLRNRGGVATRAEVDRATATANKYRAENARLQNQVSMSSVEAVQSAQAERNAAKYRADRAQEEAEQAKNRADKAEADAKRKYDDLQVDNQHKYQFIGFYAVLATFLHFITSTRCRADSLDFLYFIGMIIKAIWDWEISMFADGILYIIISLVCMVLIPILVLVGFVLICLGYKKVCIDSFMDTEGARFHAEIAGLISVVAPIYLIGFLPEESFNLWGTTMLIQTAYFVMCLVYNREG